MANISRFESTILLRLQVDNHYSLHTAHPQITILGYYRSYASTNQLTLIERLYQLFFLEIVEEQPIVATYPHAIIDRIVSHSTDKVSQSRLICR